MGGDQPADNEPTSLVQIETLIRYSKQRGDCDDDFYYCGNKKNNKEIRSSRRVYPGGLGSSENHSDSWNPSGYKCGFQRCKRLWARGELCEHRTWRQARHNVAEYYGKIQTPKWSHDEEGDEENASSGWPLLPPIQTGSTRMGAGLLNLGNSCFMNAILQCVTHTVPFVNSLRSCNHATPCADPLCILCDLRQHINLCLASSGDTVSPTVLFHQLSHILSDFQQYRQEDAHEFLLSLLNGVGRCCLESNSGDENSVSQKKNIVEEVFGGRLRNKLQCCNCGHSSHNYEPMIDLSLSIEGVDTLQNAIQSFTRVEKMDTKFTCDNCKEEAWRERQVLLDQVPLVATLQLKRFKSDGILAGKIDKSVVFPLELDFKPYTNCTKDNNMYLKYRLSAVVVHHGSSLVSGHYFCHIRSSPDTWHKLDDSMVRKFDEQSVLNEAAYILFYVRDDTPWFSTFSDTEKFCADSRDESPKSVLDNIDDADSNY